MQSLVHGNKSQFDTKGDGTGSIEYTAVSLT